MIRIGLTGGIGSGKSVVASLFGMIGIPVYVADDESKRLAAASPVIKEKLTGLLGEDIYTGSVLNRQLLASLIFGNRENLEKVNSIIHPEVNRHFREWVCRQNSRYCAIETAILFESGFDKTVDISLFVSAPLELRIERALKRNPLATREDITNRIMNQLREEDLLAKADHVIINDGVQALIPQVAGFIRSLQEREGDS